MATIEWKDDFIESYVNIGVEKGREEGREEGAITAKADDILKVLQVRHLKPTQQQRDKVTQSTDLAELKRWFDRSLTAATAAEIFRD